MQRDLIGATITCPDAGAAAALYAAALGYDQLDAGRVSAAQAARWQAPALAGAACVRLVPPGLTRPWLRFIEQPVTPPPPFTTAGWAALEFTVTDCDQAVERLSGHGFRVLGPPADLDFAQGALRAGQVLGPYGEMLYLTQVRQQLPGYTLPVATRATDRLFIAILASADLDASLAHLAGHGIPEHARFRTGVAFVADAQGLPQDHQFDIATATLAPGCYLELDHVPALPPRARQPGLLPAGVAFITLSGAQPQMLSAPDGTHIELSAD